MEQNKIKLNIVSPIFDLCGYSRHGRELVNALDKIGVDVRLETTKPDQWERYVNDAELKMIAKPFDSERISLMIGQPPYWRLEMAKKPKKFFGCCVWEGDKIPKYWIPYLLDDRVSQVWVPSQHTKDAIIKSCAEWSVLTNPNSDEHLKILEKIKIVPHGVDLNMFKPQDKGQSDKFTFVCNKGWRGGMDDRGGVGYVLKAYCEEFNKDENVELAVKLNPAYIHPTVLQAKLDELNLDKNRPPIKVSLSEVPMTEMCEIYNKGDIYVCAQRADGFNLPGLEAMACGLPTIQTDFGGQTDYVDEGNGWLIPVASLAPVQHDIGYEGICWATPNMNELKKLMRYAYTNKAETKEKGQQALKDVQYWTWDNSAKKAMNFLKELK